MWPILTCCAPNRAAGLQPRQQQPRIDLRAPERPQAWWAGLGRGSSHFNRQSNHSEPELSDVAHPLFLILRGLAGDLGGQK
jgi:hypothetical protein